MLFTESQRKSSDLPGLQCQWKGIKLHRIRIIRHDTLLWRVTCIDNGGHSKHGTAYRVLVMLSFLGRSYARNSKYFLQDLSVVRATSQNWSNSVYDIYAIREYHLTNYVIWHGSYTNTIYHTCLCCVGIEFIRKINVSNRMCQGKTEVYNRWCIQMMFL